MWLDDIPLATLRPDGGSGIVVFDIHSDHLGSPRAISRPSDNTGDRVALGWRPLRHECSSDSNPSGLGVFVYNLSFSRPVLRC